MSSTDPKQTPPLQSDLSRATIVSVVLFIAVVVYGTRTKFLSPLSLMRMDAMPHPELMTKGAKELLQAYIDVYGEEEGRWRLHGAWIQAQHQFPSSMTESILQEVCETEEDISEELVKTIRLFLSYIPRWTMYGHSLADKAKAAGVSNDKLAERLEKDYFHKGLEIVLEKYDI